MGIFGDSEATGPVQPSGDLEGAVREDTGVRAEGPFLVVFDLDDETEYCFLASRMVLVRDSFTDDGDGCLSMVRFLDEDGYCDSPVSVDAATVRGAWLAARAAEKSA